LEVFLVHSLASQTWSDARVALTTKAALTRVITMPLVASAALRTKKILPNACAAKTEDSIALSDRLTVKVTPTVHRTMPRIQLPAKLDVPSVANAESAILRKIQNALHATRPVVQNTIALLKRKRTDDAARSAEQDTQSARPAAQQTMTASHRTKTPRTKSAESDVDNANRCEWTRMPPVREPSDDVPTLPRTTKRAEHGTRSVVCAMQWQRPRVTRSVRATRAAAPKDRRLSKGTLTGGMVSNRPMAMVPLMTLTVRLS